MLSCIHDHKITQPENTGLHVSVKYHTTVTDQFDLISIFKTHLYWAKKKENISDWVFMLHSSVSEHLLDKHP